MSEDRPYLEENARELDRMRAIVERASDDDLRRKVNPHWTVAGVLGHIAFWDARNLVLGERLERGGSFSDDDVEREDVDWINDSTREIFHAIEPRRLAELALEISERTDRKMASLPAERMWPADPEIPINPLRATHRAEHLDDVERALG